MKSSKLSKPRSFSMSIMRYIIAGRLLSLNLTFYGLHHTHARYHKWRESNKNPDLSYFTKLCQMTTPLYVPHVYSAEKSLQKIQRSSYEETLLNFSGNFQGRRKLLYAAMSENFY